jgi:hypothetical protein
MDGCCNLLGAFVTCLRTSLVARAASQCRGVEALTGPLSPNQDMTQLWAWEDEAAGVMRVRTFASRVGIAEDEACGSGAMRMAAAFGRCLVLHHGRGSIIHAKPGPPGYADIGGYVAEDPTSVDRGLRSQQFSICFRGGTSAASHRPSTESSEVALGKQGLRIPAAWPWAYQITAAFTRIAAIPAPS